MVKTLYQIKQKSYASDQLITLWTLKTLGQKVFLIPITGDVFLEFIRTKSNYAAIDYKSSINAFSEALVFYHQTAPSTVLLRLLIQHHLVQSFHLKVA